MKKKVFNFENLRGGGENQEKETFLHTKKLVIRGAKGKSNCNQHSK